MPLQATSGAASYDAFGGGVPYIPQYIEDVFSTWLYTGNGTTQNITNGIDLAGKGGFVWFKNRSVAQEHRLFDTARGVTKYLTLGGADGINAQDTSLASLTAFNNNGFSIGNWTQINTNGNTYASWTFRKQPKFFDCVTYTGNGVNGRTISHNLGAVPGCIIVKRTDTANSWWVYHRSLTNERAIYLNLTNAAAFDAAWNNTDPTSTVFSVGGSNTNASGGTFVAYVFAHNAGGFGLTGTDNVISCGSFTTDGSGNATVNLGHEPQWVMYKRSDGTGSWAMFDNMRGMTVNTTNGDRILFANLTDAESTVDWIQPTSTGFNPFNIATNATYIYIAIRRGPMRTPTTGTSVFDVKTATQAVNSSSRPPAVNFVTDFAFYRKRETTFNWGAVTRLAGSGYLFTNTTNAEASGPFAFDVMNGFYPNTSPWDSSGDYVFDYFRRAPGFMDVCCYTGTGVARTVAHNLTVVPELMIVKNRSGADVWGVWNKSRPLAGDILYLNLTIGWDNNAGYFNSTNPTASVFSLGASTSTNGSGSNYVAYLFATCPGVSKVGSYTGTGTTQTINCGFTAGARFVLIKRADSTGDWYVWDSARGIVAGNDPYLLLNSTAAEVTSTDFIDTAATGFEISSTAPAAINANGGTFIFLAIA